MSNRTLSELAEQVGLHVVETFDEGVIVLAAELTQFIEDDLSYREMLAAPPEVSHRINGWTTLKRAAGLCKYDRETVRLWAVSKKVAAKRHGGRWYVQSRSVLAYARSAKERGVK
jgi:hypothetical protein